MRKDDARPDFYITMQPGTDHTGQPLDGFFDAFVGSRQLSASDRPFRDATLALLELGAPPDATLTARHPSGHQVTATLASAAAGSVTALTFHHGGRREPLKVVVHQVVDRRGRRLFLTTIAGRALCTSPNPIVCSAAALREAGWAEETPVLFQDPVTGIEETIALGVAAEWEMPGLSNNVVPFRGKAVQS